MALLYCDSKYDAVISAFEKRSFVETTSLHSESHDACPFVWQKLSNIKFSTICPKQFVNHINGIHNLSNKAYLLYHLYGNQCSHITPPSWSSAVHTIPQLLEMLTTYEIFCRAQFHDSSISDAVLQQLAALIFGINSEKNVWHDLLQQTGEPGSDLLQHIQDSTYWKPWCGDRSLWLIKPVGKSCGEGIRVVQGVHAVLTATREMEFKCIVQKYIERPLLVRNRRKFDIRQWVLITEVNPLVIFGFSECYCRLSGVEYSTASEGLLNQQIHLCNHSIQKQHIPSADTPSEESLHCDTMMSQQEFDNFLLTSGHQSFYDMLLPKIRDITINTILSCRDKLIRVGRGFEWLGLDLMVTGNMDVRLLEVNVSPDISYSTPITERLVKHAVDDLLYLLLDGALDERLGASPSNGSILQWEPWYIGSTESKSSLLSLTNEKINTVGRLDSAHSPKELEMLVIAEELLQNKCCCNVSEDEEL